MKTKGPRIPKRDQATLEAFALACGITHAEAVLIRDDLALVGLSLPRLGISKDA